MLPREIEAAALEKYQRQGNKVKTAAANPQLRAECDLRRLGSMLTDYIASGFALERASDIRRARGLKAV